MGDIKGYTGSLDYRSHGFHVGFPTTYPNHGLGTQKIGNKNDMNYSLNS